MGGARGWEGRALVAGDTDTLLVTMEKLAMVDHARALEEARVENERALTRRVLRVLYEMESVLERLSAKDRATYKKAAIEAARRELDMGVVPPEDDTAPELFLHGLRGVLELGLLAMERTPNNRGPRSVIRYEKESGPVGAAITLEARREAHRQYIARPTERVLGDPPPCLVPGVGTSPLPAGAMIEWDPARIRNSFYFDVTVDEWPVGGDHLFDVGTIPKPFASLGPGMLKDKPNMTGPEAAFTAAVGTRLKTLKSLKAFGETLPVPNDTPYAMCARLLGPLPPPKQVSPDPDWDARMHAWPMRVITLHHLQVPVLAQGGGALARLLVHCEHLLMESVNPAFGHMYITNVYLPTFQSTDRRYAYMDARFDRNAMRALIPALRHPLNFFGVNLVSGRGDDTARFGAWDLVWSTPMWRALHRLVVNHRLGTLNIPTQWDTASKALRKVPPAVAAARDFYHALQLWFATQRVGRDAKETATLDFDGTNATRTTVQHTMDANPENGLDRPRHVHPDPKKPDTRVPANSAAFIEKTRALLQGVAGTEHPISRVVLDLVPLHHFLRTSGRDAHAVFFTAPGFDPKHQKKEIMWKLHLVGRAEAEYGVLVLRGLTMHPVLDLEAARSHQRIFLAFLVDMCRCYGRPFFVADNAINDDARRDILGDMGADDTGFSWPSRVASMGPWARFAVLAGGLLFLPCQKSTEVRQDAAGRPRAPNMYTDEELDELTTRMFPFTSTEKLKPREDDEAYHVDDGIAPPPRPDAEELFSPAGEEAYSSSLPEEDEEEDYEGYEEEEPVTGLDIDSSQAEEAVEVIEISMGEEEEEIHDAVVEEEEEVPLAVAEVEHVPAAPAIPGDGASNAEIEDYIIHLLLRIGTLTVAEKNVLMGGSLASRRIIKVWYDHYRPLRTPDKFESDANMKRRFHALIFPMTAEQRAAKNAGSRERRRRSKGEGGGRGGKRPSLHAPEDAEEKKTKRKKTEEKEEEKKKKKEEEEVDVHVHSHAVDEEEEEDVNSANFGEEGEEGEEEDAMDLEEPPQFGSLITRFGRMSLLAHVPLACARCARRPPALADLYVAQGAHTPHFTCKRCACAEED